MKQKSCIFFLLFSLCFVSCGDRTRLDVVYDAAGLNGIELKKAIDHYAEKAEDSLKLKAATFIIENMPGHGSFQSESAEKYRHAIYSADTIVAKDSFDVFWNKYKDAASDRPKLQLDIHTVNADFLIKDIDKAFDTWQKAKWKKEIDFNLFCRYILPYRIQTEMLAAGWRDSLYDRYYSYVKDAKTAKQAFEIIHDVVRKQTAQDGTAFPYVLDGIALMKQKKAPCAQFCVKLGLIARAVGLPVAVDLVDFWANYSTNGHAWVALITSKGTYTVYDDEYEAKILNKIDATQFRLKYLIPADYPLITYFKKRPAKIYRNTYECCKVEEIDDCKYWKDLAVFKDPFRLDVSSEYGLRSSADITASENASMAYLCAYHAGHGWKPVAFNKVEKRKCRFINLADSVIYLPVTVDDGEVKAAEPPFYIVGNVKKHLAVDMHRRQTVCICRKYPLTGRFLNRWASMFGGRFEGSNDSTFKTFVPLHRITYIPVFRNIVDINAPIPFRYMRYHSADVSDTPIAEIEFYGKDGKLKPRTVKNDVENIEKSIDGNTFTSPKTNKKHGYCFTYDLGESANLTKIIYYPRNDGNFVVPKHEYELYYFDRDWKSLGKKKATGYELIYNNVPCGALLFLTDKATGKETRPFTIEDNKQVWW